MDQAPASLSSKTSKVAESLISGENFSSGETTRGESAPEPRSRSQIFLVPPWNRANTSQRSLAEMKGEVSAPASWVIRKGSPGAPCGAAAARHKCTDPVTLDAAIVPTSEKEALSTAWVLSWSTSGRGRPLACKDLRLNSNCQVVRVLFPTRRPVKYTEFPRHEYIGGYNRTPSRVRALDMPVSEVSFPSVLIV